MRAIDADKLKEVLEKNFGHTGGASVLTQLIDAQDTIQLELHWIPCSKKLPEVKQKVLVQYADESMATKRCNDAGHLAWFYSNAVAWMPAPASWKGE